MDYLRALFRHTIARLAGGLGLVLTAVGIVTPAFVPITGLVVLALALVAAQYLVYRDARNELDAERSERAADSAKFAEAERRWAEREAALVGRLDQREKRKALRESLGEMFALGEVARSWIERAGAPVSHSQIGGGVAYFGTKPKDSVDADLKGSIERASEWEDEVASFLSQYLGNSYAHRFRSDLGTTEREHPRMSPRGPHPRAWVRIDRRLQVLADIIKEVGEDLIGI